MTATDALIFYGIEANDFVEPEDVAAALGLIPLDDPYASQEDAIQASLPDGLAFDVHCHSDSSMPLIGVASTIARAHRGYALRLTELPVPDPALSEALETLAAKLGWKPPSWYLASYWDSRSSA